MREIFFLFSIWILGGWWWVVLFLGGLCFSLVVAVVGPSGGWGLTCVSLF